MEYCAANVFCGIIVFVLTSQFAHSNVCSDPSFTIEVTNSSNGIFTAKEDTSQRITTTVTPVTSCNEWQLSVSENKIPQRSFVINAIDVCTVNFGRDKCTCSSRGARGQEFHFNKNVTRKDNGVILKWNVELANFRTNPSKTVTLNITHETKDNVQSARASQVLSSVAQVVANTCVTFICFAIVALIVNYIRKRGTMSLRKMDEITQRQVSADRNEFHTVDSSSMNEITEQLVNEEMTLNNMDEITSTHVSSNQREFDTVYYSSIEDITEELENDHYDTLRNQEIGIQSKYTSLNTLGHKVVTWTDDHDTNIDTELPYEALKQNEVGQRSPYTDLSK